VTAYLVLEFVRRARSLREATAAGLVFALSPVMFIISGFHGNTDPVFVMFILLSAYLLTVKDRPALAGASAALACSVKLVPIVPLPALIVAIAHAASLFAPQSATSSSSSPCGCLPSLDNGRDSNATSSSTRAGTAKTQTGASSTPLITRTFLTSSTTSPAPGGSSSF
jgi:hypothetical protein